MINIILLIERGILKINFGDRLLKLRKERNISQETNILILISFYKVIQINLHKYIYLL